MKNMSLALPNLKLSEEDILLLGIIFLVFTEESFDKYLLIALIYIFISGIDQDLLHF